VSDFDISVDSRLVEQALAKMDAKANNKAILKGERAAAKFLKPLVKKAAPVGPKSDGHSGSLRRSVAQFTAKRQKPGAGIRVKARHRHLVIRGTRKRATKSGANRGVMPANPFVANVAEQHGDHAADIAIEAIAKALDL
jgi:hypothetical protein